MGGMTATQMAVMLGGPSTVTFQLWLDGQVFSSEDIMALETGDEWGQGGDVLPIIRFNSEANHVELTEGVSALSIAPVPAMSEAWMHFDLHHSGQVRISIFDARGAEVAILHDGQMAAGPQRMLLNVEQWASGTYFVKGTAEHGVFRAPFIVR
jgi:hypothetical protein